MLENPRGTPFNWVVDYVDQWDAWLIWVNPGWQFAKINYWWRMVNGRFMGYDEHENSFTMCVYNKWFNLEDLEFRQQKLKTEHGRFSRPNCQLIYLLHESSPCIIFLWPCSDYPAQGPAAHAQHCLSTSIWWAPADFMGALRRNSAAPSTSTDHPPRKALPLIYIDPEPKLTDFNEGLPAVVC